MTSHTLIGLVFAFLIFSRHATVALQSGCNAALASEELATQGWTLLRNCQDNEELHADRFTALVQQVWKAAGFDYAIGDYEGGSVVRKSVSYGSSEGAEADTAKIYDVAAGSPADKPVQAHSENAYLAMMPHFVAFGCVRRADSGGSVTLSNLARVTENLLAEGTGSSGALVFGKLADLGVMYERRMGCAENSSNWPFATGFWQDRFPEAEGKFSAAIAQVCANPWYGKNSTLVFEEQTGTALLRWTLPGIASAPVSPRYGNRGTEGRMKALIVTSILDHHKRNDIVGKEGSAVPPKHCMWGDGSEISAEELQTLTKAFLDPLVSHSVLMEAGDVVVADNLRFAHGREPYAGTRKHIAMFSEKVDRM